MCENKETLYFCIYIKDTHQEHFETVVDYLLSRESASFILQERDVDSTILSKVMVLKFRSGCWRMEYLENWSSCIRDSGMDGIQNIFIPSVTTRMQPL